MRTLAFNILFVFVLVTPSVQAANVYERMALTGVAACVFFLGAGGWVVLNVGAEQKVAVQQILEKGVENLHRSDRPDTVHVNGSTYLIRNGLLMKINPVLEEAAITRRFQPSVLEAPYPSDPGIARER